ncbi:MAG: acetyl-CoA carboxylase, carboxyltransferase subunit beta [Armatimonadota bacterium]
MTPATWFKSRGGAARKTARQGADALPDGLWTKCPGCGEILFRRELEKNLRVCNKCGYHYRLSARERIEITADEGTFREIAAELVTVNPLGFPDYEAKVSRDRERTGLEDGMVVGTAEIGGRPVALGVTDWFMGGSMGSVYGEKVTRLMELAIRKRLPVVIFTMSGGARMQEGILSLMQMAKTAAAAARLRRAGLPYIVVLADPTTAGVHASFASLGDFIFAEPGALIGFAGARVAAQAGLIDRPADFQTSEFQLAHGMIDRIVPRREIKSTLIKIIDFCSSAVGVASGAGAGEESKEAEDAA